MKKMLAIILCCTLLAGCGNGNVFSWAHNPGSGDFASLKSDGDAAMKNNDYSKAAEYYKAALEKNPNDADTALGYATAKFFEAVGSQYGDIINMFLNPGTGAADTLLGFLDDGTLQKLIDALYDSIGEPGSENGPLANAANQPGASTDLLLNAALINLLLAIAEALVAAKPYRHYLRINSDYTVEVLGTPTNDEKLVLIAILDRLFMRVETSLKWLQNAPIANLPPGVDQSKVLEEINGYLTLFKAQINEEKNKLL